MSREECGLETCAAKRTQKCDKYKKELFGNRANQIGSQCLDVLGKLYGCSE